MTWNDHSKFVGLHAFLGASKYHWINYDKQKLISAWQNNDAQERGTRLHAFACECISLKQKLPKSKKTLNQYVNDAIGFHMDPEVVLYFSPNCFGTTDAIAFEDGYLRIHDYKSGTTPAHIEQLRIYAALFCLEYGYKPSNITTELRIYQSDDILIEMASPDDIADIMKKIIQFDKILNSLQEE